MDEDLTPAAEGILAELTEYHRHNLRNVQESLRRKREAGNRSKPISLARALRAMASPSGLRESPEGEFFETIAKLSGGSYDPQRIVIPWVLIRRDLSAATASSAGYLIHTETQEVVDLLRPWSVTARAGITVETNLIGDQVIPKVTAKSSPAWQSNETAQISPSQTTLAQIALTPKQVGIVINFSRQLSLQANADTFVRRELLRTVGSAIDQAILSGTGASGQPLGLLNTTGVQTEPGTSLAQAGVVGMKKKAADQNASDAQVTFLATPAVRELLEKRERGTGSGFVWDNDRVASRPAMVSTDVPAATMICGDWQNVHLGLWGPGLVVEINPYDATGFKSGTIQARILVSLDVAILQPSAFVVASTIT